MINPRYFRILKNGRVIVPERRVHTYDHWMGEATVDDFALPRGVKFDECEIVFMNKSKGKVTNRGLMYSRPTMMSLPRRKDKVRTVSFW